MSNNNRKNERVVIGRFISYCNKILTRVCIVYVVKEVTSFLGAEPIKKHAASVRLFIHLVAYTTTSMSTASMENKKAKRALCKRVLENENLTLP